MKQTLKRAIDEYNSIFKSTKEDYRMSCEDVNDFTLNCLAMDGIQLCACCIVKMSQLEPNATLFNQYQMIEWKCVRYISTGQYVFYPWLKDDVGMEEARNNLGVDVCEKYGYINGSNECEDKKDTNDFHIFKTCKADWSSEDVESVGLETDVIFNMNRNGRKIEDLRKLCKILCCFKLEVMHSFFRSMIKYMKGLEKKEEKEKFESEVNSFYSEVIQLNEVLKAKDYKTFQEIRETSKEIAALMQKRRKSDKFVLNDLHGREVSFQKKLESFFIAQNSWSEGKGIAGSSCKDYLGEIKQLAKG